MLGLVGRVEMRSYDTETMENDDEMRTPLKKSLLP